jgi:DNA polymerase-1
MWGLRRDAAERVLRQHTPESVIANIRSKIQISNFLKSVLDDRAIAAWPKTDKTKQLQTTRAILRMSSFRAPYPFSRWLAALMVFNRADKYLSTYGQKLITSQELAGRIYPRLNIAQAITGRLSSSGAMNEQNLPNSKTVRKSFIAGEGKKLVVADYSGVEIRVLAEVSGDEQLKQDCIYGDVHSESAVTIFNYEHGAFFNAIENNEGWAKGQRGKAKGFTFQLTYGAGGGALSMVLRCSVDEANEFVKKWAARYPKAYHYRQFMYEKMGHSGYLPVVSGRTIYVSRKDRTMPVASNYPIQGAAADVMYRAITRVQYLLEFYEVSAWVMATIHDEVIVLAEEAHAKRAAELVKQGMTEAWLDIFPNTSTDNLLEVGIGDDWAEAK